MEKFEQLDAILDRVLLMGQQDYFIDVEMVRGMTDQAYDLGQLADYEWKALKSRCDKVQDMLGEKP